MNLLASEETLITLVQFVQDTLQSVHGSLAKKVAVRVGVVAPHRELLHHLVLAEQFLFASTVAGLLDRQGPIPDEPLAASILTHQVFLSTGWLKPVVRESLLYLHGDCTWPVRSTSLALAIASISSGFAKRVLYPLKAPAALGTMWRTQPSGTAGNTNTGHLMKIAPKPLMYTSLKTTQISRLAF